VTAQINSLKTRAKWREVPTELRHSEAIARKDLAAPVDYAIATISTRFLQAQRVPAINETAENCGVARNVHN
jgi:hypothetical protein